MIFYCRPDSLSLVYEKPYCRIAPYLVGMVLGYLLIHSKDWRLPTKVTYMNFTTFAVKFVVIKGLNIGIQKMSITCKL